jgi:predicted nucleotidyltransferase
MIMNNSTQQAIADLLKSQREEIISIAAKHGAFNVRIFGSVARSEADSDSDIDFLVDYSIDNISPWFPAGLVLDLEKLLGCKVDVATESALKDRIRERVLSEAIAL